MDIYFSLYGILHASECSQDAEIRKEEVEDVTFVRYSGLWESFIVNRPHETLKHLSEQFNILPSDFCH